MSRGYTLIEIVIAMLLMSIMVSSVFTVALSVRQGGGKSERRMEASRITVEMTNMLKNYVTSDPYATAIAGPNKNNAVNAWSLDDGVIQDSWGRGGPNIYALAPGTHTVVGVLPQWFADPPYNATLNYYVGNERINGDPDLPAPQVNVWVDWTEP